MFGESMYSSEDLRIRPLSIAELKVGRLYSYMSQYDGIDRARLSPTAEGYGPRDDLKDGDTLVVLNIDDHINGYGEEFIRVQVLSQFGPRWLFYKVKMIRHAPTMFRELI